MALPSCGVKPTVEDLIFPLAARNEAEIYLYILNMLLKDIGNLISVIPDIMSQILSFEDIFNMRLNQENVIDLLVSNGLAITVNDLKLAFDKKHVNIVQYFIVHMDSWLGVQVSLEMPDILIQILRLSFIENVMECVVKNLFTIILKNINVLVNYVNSSQDSVIQCIMDLVDKGRITLAIDFMDLVAKRDEFDIEQIVAYKQYFGTIQLRPIEMAMEMKKYEFVIKLIMTGAKCQGIQYDHMKHDKSAIKLLKLLYHVGLYVNVAEGDLIFTWAQMQAINLLKPLYKLAAMAVQRTCTPSEINDTISGLVLPEKISRCLDLKHLNLDD